MPLVLNMLGVGLGVKNLDVLYFRLLLLVTFLLEHNVDEKSYKILTSEFT